MFTLNCKGKILQIEKPIIMGIINVTSDSFYTNSRVQNNTDILKMAEKMINDGATILDIGGQSTRPNSTEVGIDEELKKVIPAIESIKNEFPETIVSIDTYHSKVASESVNAGADMINDISGGNFDSEMLQTVSKLKAPYICMHIQGKPENMQDNPTYENICREILDYFIQKLEVFQQHSIFDVIFDPGFGFGKNMEHNFQLLKNLETFKILEKPILVGISRKSFIYKTLKTSAENALNGTTAMHMAALQSGANILRVHDVKEAVEVVNLHEALNS